MRSGIGLYFLLGILPLAAQQAAPTPPSAAPQLSPDAAYDLAVRPLDIVRRSMENWSDSEAAAFSVAIQSAKQECAARTPQQFSGEDLVGYAKLCSLGQDWSAMGVAAGMYIDGATTPKPQLATAYGFQVESKLHVHDVAGTLSVESSMLHDIPYGETADTVTNEALSYLQLAHTAEALTLHAMRQPLLLAELKSDKPLLPRPALYADGLAKAALEQYDGKPDAAAVTVAELDAALKSGVGPALVPDDAIPIELLRTRYALLGKPLPPLTYQLSLKDVKEKPHVTPGAATAFLLYPEWCAQCVRMAPDLWDAITRLSDQEIRVYGLIAEPTPNKAALLIEQNKPMGPDVPPVARPGMPAPDPKSRTASMLLLHTPTLVVSPEALQTFAATDFPFLIVVDRNNIVRFAEPAPESVLRPGDFLDRVASHVAEQWPTAKLVRAAVVK